MMQPACFRRARLAAAASSGRRVLWARPFTDTPRTKR